MAGNKTVPIENAIIMVRDQRVILASDLARIYGVETRVLNQAVKRNIDKFPEDFVVRLTRSEAEDIANSRSQSVTLKRGENIKYLPLYWPLGRALRVLHPVACISEVTAHGQRIITAYFTSRIGKGSIRWQKDRP